MVGQGLAVLIGSLLGAFLTRTLAPEALESWGWRVPFLFGLLIGPLGLYIRRHLAETDAFLESRRAPAGQRALGAVLTSQVRGILVCMGICISGTISFYVILLYMPTFARVQLHLPLDQSFAAQAISLACMIVLIPIFGALSDYVGRKPVTVAALVVYLALTYPLFSWLNANPSFLNLVIVQVTLCSVLGVFFGPLSTAFAEQFPAHVRSTALAIAYNVSVMVFGGFAQFFVTWLIGATGSAVAPAFYVLFGAAVGLLAALFLKDRAHEARLAVTDVAEANVA
jgi:MFS family permease